MNLKFDELTRFYHLVYMPYYKDGIICTFNREKGNIVIWRFDDENKVWVSGVEFPSYANLESGGWYYEFMDECALAIHKTRFPVY